MQAGFAAPTGFWVFKYPATLPQNLEVFGPESLILNGFIHE
jgi:hypothetical protein